MSSPVTAATRPIDLPFSPAAERNASPILAVLQGWLPPTASVLEVASGSGQHAAAFAAAQPGWTWQPTEADARLLPAIAARCAGLAAVQPPRLLDLLQSAVLAAGSDRHDAVYVANLTHIAPWPATVALLQMAATVLAPTGVLFVYGPFIVDGEPLAPSNAAFDADLRSRHPQWGLRRLAALVQAAEQAGLQLAEQRAMPANNLLLRFERTA